MGWVRAESPIRAAGFTTLPTPPSCAAPLVWAAGCDGGMEMMENPCPWVSSCPLIRLPWTRVDPAAAPISACCRVSGLFGLGREVLSGPSAAEPITACCGVSAWLGLGERESCAVGDTGWVADSGVASGAGRRWARASPASIFSGFRSRDRAAPCVPALWSWIGAGCWVSAVVAAGSWATALACFSAGGCFDAAADPADSAVADSVGSTGCMWSILFKSSRWSLPAQLEM